MGMVEAFLLPEERVLVEKLRYDLDLPTAMVRVWVPRASAAAEQKVVVPT